MSAGSLASQNSFTSTATANTVIQRLSNNNNNNNQNTKSFPIYSQPKKIRPPPCRRSSSTYLSETEKAILNSNYPIRIDENDSEQGQEELEEIVVNGERGYWINKNEEKNWIKNNSNNVSFLPLNEYEINQDSDPTIITKKCNQKITLEQEIAIRYLRPPTPPSPGPLIIKQECGSLLPPAVPLIIRQQPPRPHTPAPLVIREAPPPPPPSIEKKVVFFFKFFLDKI
jgi:hypothetical protein